MFLPFFSFILFVQSNSIQSFFLVSIFFPHLFLFGVNKRKKMSMSRDGAGPEAQNRASHKEACLTEYCL